MLSLCIAWEHLVQTEKSKFFELGAPQRFWRKWAGWNVHSLQPRKRSALRIDLGKKYYRTKRYLAWYFGEKKYATHKAEQPLKHLVFRHQTVLLRQLHGEPCHYDVRTAAGGAQQRCRGTMTETR